jgi:hypothetical protein
LRRRQPAARRGAASAIEPLVEANQRAPGDRGGASKGDARSNRNAQPRARHTATPGIRSRIGRLVGVATAIAAPHPPRATVSDACAQHVDHHRDRIASGVRACPLSLRPRPASWASRVQPKNGRAGVAHRFLHHRQRSTPGLAR